MQSKENPQSLQFHMEENVLQLESVENPTEEDGACAMEIENPQNSKHTEENGACTCAECHYYFDIASIYMRDDGVKKVFVGDQIFTREEFLNFLGRIIYQTTNQTTNEK